VEHLPPEWKLLLYLYPKNVQDNLTPGQLRQLKTIVEEEYHGR
jgi:hypothetical protein